MRLHKGRFSSYGEAKGVPRGLDWLAGDPDGNVMMILSRTKQGHFVDGKFSPFDFALKFSQAAGVSRPKSSRLFSNAEQKLRIAWWADGG